MLTVILDMTLTEDGLEAFLTNAKERLPDTRNYAGCLGLTALQDQNNPFAITFYETWESREHYEKYLAWREEQGATEGLRQQSAVPPRWRFFDVLDV